MGEVLKTGVTVIILTYNEEVNISNSVSNVIEWARDVFILDSGSTDRTCELAETLGAKVFYNKFENYAKQRNHAINKLPVETEWIFFLDADEYLTEELKKEIQETISSAEYDGFYIKRRFYFMGRWIKHGGYYPTWILRLFRKNKGIVDRDINEYVKVSGKVGYLKNDFIDDNKKGISDWIAKHNKYSTYEAEELIKFKNRKDDRQKDEFAKLFGAQTQRKKWIKENLYVRLPLFLRSFFYFIYRYFFRLGFLDGREGLIFHFLQGFWYFFLIDAKLCEIRNNSKKE